MLSGVMRTGVRSGGFARGLVLGGLFSVAALGALAQSGAPQSTSSDGVAAQQPATTPQQVVTSQTEIPLERCDKLPVVKVRVGERAYQFLVDTAATSMLNLNRSPAENRRKCASRRGPVRRRPAPAK